MLRPLLVRVLLRPRQHPVKRIKYLIVAGLERACAAVDLIPWVWEGHWYRHGLLGCYPLRLADRSSRLEDKWKTGYWKIQDVST